ncbi:MAG: nascent polypeptide-associated complex protein [Candidatus Woesearchaeota archaeon]|jgi:nascent polypeptide-associated complex subunit alpha|nr:nascent polypeptide-associated complex protein [Candidatus Woesearchaeota archaeon]MDP7623205.1 nascent polypeptide-associated complex protein [Candidatus Woesearchaeota archaeon]HJN56808.1 nascent polypeptide-associated complex protein [Candidatus Woesearchaeota archaeon]|tara:strand:- start:32735 stop:33076 length:342 start_codon:yes stop_codon:yes gene_type:complete
MLPGMNSRQAQAMMKKMGIQQVEIPANEVIIKTDEKEIVITNPQVSKVNMMGQETFQVVGNIEERDVSSEPEINQEDVNTVMEQTGASEEKAKEAIAKNEGDLAKTIMELKGQ